MSRVALGVIAQLVAAANSAVVVRAQPSKPTQLAPLHKGNARQRPGIRGSADAPITASWLAVLHGKEPNLSATLDIISVKRRSFTEGDDETNSSLHTNNAHVTVHSSVSMWDTAQSVAV